MNPLARSRRGVSRSADERTRSTGGQARRDAADHGGHQHAANALIRVPDAEDRHRRDDGPASGGGALGTRAEPRSSSSSQMPAVTRLRRRRASSGRWQGMTIRTPVTARAEPAPDAFVPPRLEQFRSRGNTITHSERHRDPRGRAGGRHDPQGRERPAGPVPEHPEEQRQRPLLGHPPGVETEAGAGIARLDSARQPRDGPHAGRDQRDERRGERVIDPGSSTGFSPSA